MANLNKVMLMGNLTRDPVSKSTQGGMSICEFGLAVNRRYKNAHGEEKDDTCFVDVSVFGKTADACTRFLHRGSLVYIEGRLKFDQWVDKTSGQKRNQLRIIAEQVQFLERRGDGGRNPQAVSYDDRGQAVPPSGVNRNVTASQLVHEEIREDMFRSSANEPPLSVYVEEQYDDEMPF